MALSVGGAVLKFEYFHFDTKLKLNFHFNKP